jgi:PAS domain S-box-containing protein
MNAAGGRRNKAGDPIVLPDFRALFEATPGLCLVLSPTLNIVAMNDAYCRATMTVREEIVGRNLFEVFPHNPDTPNSYGVSNLRPSLERVLQLRRPDAMPVQKYDIRLPASEGGGFEERYWSPLNSPVFNGKDEVLWIIHRVEDVTQLVRLKAEGEARDKLAQEQQRIIDQLRSSNEQLVHRIAENKRLEAERREAHPAAESNNLTLEALVAERTKHLQGANEEMRRSGEVLRNTAESLADQVLVADETGDLILANPAAARLFGSPANVRDLTKNHRLFSPDGVTILPDEQGPLMRAISGDPTDNFEFIRRDAGGKDVHFVASGRPIRNATGAVKGALAVYHDITVLRATEARLRQAQKMEALGQLTGGIAHDFNNVLSVILSNAEMLVEELGESGDLCALAEMTRTAAERGAELTKSLLAFAGRQALEPQVIDINKLIFGMDGILRRTLGEDIEVKLLQGTGLWQAVADPVQLESALLNLALNARDAMIEGGRLTIETSNAHLEAGSSEAHDEVTPGRYILICVSDTGTGMTAAVAARAFDPFFSTKEVGKGTGLGLSMVYGFVKQSGGHIKICSEVGHGALFKIYLPRALEEQSSAK